MITEGKNSGLRLIGPVEQIQCTETGQEILDDVYECNFYTESQAGTRSERDALTQEEVRSIHYGDVDMDRLNDNHHSITRPPVHASVFEGKGGCLYNKDSRGLLCFEMEDAQDRFERNERRLSHATR